MRHKRLSFFESLFQEAGELEPQLPPLRTQQHFPLGRGITQCDVSDLHWKSVHERNADATERQECCRGRFIRLGNLKITHVSKCYYLNNHLSNLYVKLFSCLLHPFQAFWLRNNQQYRTFDQDYRKRTLYMYNVSQAYSNVEYYANFIIKRVQQQSPGLQYNQPNPV